MKIGIALRCAAALLCLVSAIYTMLLCLSFAETKLLQGLMAATGFALELMKFAIFPAVFVLWQRAHRTTSLLCALLGTALIAVSFAASVAFFSEAESTKATEQLNRSAEYQLWQNQLSSLSTRIALLQDSASRDLDNGYRSRANTTLAAIEKAERKRSSLMSQRPQQIVTPQLPIDSRLTYAVLALLIEICAIAGLTVPRLLSTKPTRRKRRRDTTAKRRPVEPSNGGNTGETGSNRGSGQTTKAHREDRSTAEKNRKDLYKTTGAQNGSPAPQMPLNL